MRKTFLAAFGAAMLAAAPLGGASALEAGAAGLSQPYSGESYSQYRRYYGPRHHGPRHFGPRHGYRRGFGPGAAAGAIGGLAAGAIIGGAIASSQAQAAPLPRTQDPDYIAYCSRKYRSFDPIDGTFLANDGNRYPCE